MSAFYRCLSFTGVSLMSSLLAAAEPAVAGGDDGLRWQITPYVLAANIAGDVTMGRAAGVPVEVDTGQILDHLDIGGMLHAEVWYQRWGFLAEVVGMKLSDSVTATGPAGQTSLTADVEITEMVYEAALAYRLTSDERITADLVAGARIWDLSTKVNLSGAHVENGISQDDLWVDPLLGARALWRFADRWSLIGRGDIGGFGVGSDFAWNASAYVGFEAAHWCTLVLGYRAIGVDYDNEDQRRCVWRCVHFLIFDIH